jgi:hypothetical protein
MRVSIKLCRICKMINAATVTNRSTYKCLFYYFQGYHPHYHLVFLLIST